MKVGFALVVGFALPCHSGGRFQTRASFQLTVQQQPDSSSQIAAARQQQRLIPVWARACSCGRILCCLDPGLCWLSICFVPVVGRRIAGSRICVRRIAGLRPDYNGAGVRAAVSHMNIEAWVLGAGFEARHAGGARAGEADDFYGRGCAFRFVALLWVSVLF